VDTYSDNESFDLASLFDMSTSASAPTSKKVTTTRLPGGYGARRAKASVVAHGHISDEVAEQIWRAALSLWNIGGSSEESRDELLWCLAEVFVHGTSSEIDWYAVKFTYGGTEHDLGAFHSVCSQNVPYVNPIRVFVRDFRKAEIAMRIHELLNNAENLELRQRQIARYGTSVENARFCFDTAHALFDSGMTLKPTDIHTINQLAKVAISNAHEDAVSRGFASAPSDHAGVVGGSKPSPQVTPAPQTDSGARAGFKSVR
jgi:hypothetical protein